METKNILWISEHSNHTGYARVSSSLIHYLQPTFTITSFDTLQYNFEQAAFKLKTLDLATFHTVFILADVETIDFFLQGLKFKNYTGNVVVYVPIEFTGQNPDWFANYDIVRTVVAYTNFGAAEIAKACPALAGKIKVIPHGIDTSVFYPIERPLTELREKIFGKDKFNNSFIFLNANRNQPRKRLDISIRAFAKFAEGKEDVWLYMHCKNTDNSIDVQRIAQRYGCADKIIISERTDITDEQLNLLYNICDAGINSSMGEGWGLCSTEMAAAGKPQIVPNHSACAELFYGCGLLTKIITDITFDGTMLIGKLVCPDKLAEQMHTFYAQPRLAESCAKNSFEKFTNQEYSWEQIADQWQTLL